uniref:E3 ubiquitin protein ligase RIE1-like n=1 Tax=Erigeron canadensis TaxID=72917 RepID=UPI001CB8E9A2|nr:E3 ubiquitin protein ligase RIE1-like [Erigeron canadensis]
MEEEIIEVNDPLIPVSQNTTATPANGRADTINSTALFFLRGFFAGRRFVSFPLMIVRYMSVELLDDWKEDFGYLLPVVVTDTIWNLAFVVASVVMLILSVSEKPNEPVRVWLCVYLLQCVVHVVLVWLEYVRRNRLDSSRLTDSTTDISTQIR